MSFHDNRPIGWVNPHTGVTFARVLQFTCAMDNHNPLPRRTTNGVLEVWEEPDGSLHSYQLPGWGDEKDAHRAVYLVDNGFSVRAVYVAGYSQDQDRITLKPFPVSFYASGEPVRREDNNQPVDHSTWLHGPARAYHLKIIRD